MIKNKVKIHLQGASAIELALLLPVFILIFLGTLEAGWGFFIKTTFSDAAREGARIAVTQNVSSTVINNAVNNIISAANLSTASVTVTISPVNFTAQAKGTPISVTVSSPYNAIGILPTPMFLGGITLTGQTTMAKEY